jgi:hypothetical protein
MFRSLVLATLAACLFVAGATAAPAPTLDRFRAASAELSEAVSAADAAGRPLPRVSDPAREAMIRDALDQRVLALISWTDFGPAASNCMPALNALQMYAMTGTGAADRGGQGETSPEGQKIVTANAFRYHDEQVLAATFAVSCAAQLTTGMSSFWNNLSESERNPARRQGIAQMRRGILSIYDGLVGMLTEAPYTPANKALIVEAIIRNTPLLGATLTPDLRTRVANSITLQLPSLSATARADLIRVRDSLLAMPCEGLCLVS